MHELQIIPYRSEFRQQLLNLVVRAWQPVFAKTQNELPSLVYENFYPQGWQTRQVDEVATLLDTESDKIDLALKSNQLAGFVGISIHPEDQMGEIYIIAVAPEYQRQGIAKALLAFAEQRIRAAGMKMVMVETLGDTGHLAARRTYEALGYQNCPVARYFKPL